MKTTGSAFSRRLRAGVALRALAAGSALAGDLRSGNNPGARIGTRYVCRCLTAAFAALGLTVVAPTSPGHAQAPPDLGTLGSFGVVAGQAITNTPLSPTVITGDLGIHPNDATSVTGFTFSDPPGLGIVTGATHFADGPALAAKNSLTSAITDLAGRPTSSFGELTGQDLGGKVLVPGVYNFSSSAQLTGLLALNGLGNPNSVFIFKIGSLLTTASASSVLLFNGAQGGNVFWQVDTATLDTTTSFAGDILASTSISLNTGANITCGAAWANIGAVTLDDNNISICDLGAGSGGLDSQLSGEAGTGAAQAGTQAMNSFLSLVTSPFSDNRIFAPESPPPGPQPVYKALPRVVAKGAPLGPAPDPRRWGIWGAAYGGQSNAAGDASAGSHDRSVRTYGFATGLDYRVTPDTVAGFALAGGRTDYGLSDGLGGGHSDMFQAAVYSTTWINAAYVSAALAYAWHQVSTDRYVTLAGTDHLTADFSAHSVGARIEGGYRYAIPGVLGLPGRYGFTPYAAAQVQAFRTPSYSESAASGSAMFALAYDARTTTTTRTELGAWFDWSAPVNHGATLALRSRLAWAHDFWSDPSITATLLPALPGSSFTVTGAAPASDLLLASASMEMSFGNGFSLGARFDGEFAEHSQKYAGTARLRYTW